MGGLETYNVHLARSIVGAGCTVDVWSVYDCREYVGDVEGMQVHPLAPHNRLLMSIYFRYLWQKLLLHRLRNCRGVYDLAVVGHIKLVPTVQEATEACHWPYWVWTYGREAWASWDKGVWKAMSDAQRIISISQYTARRIENRLPDFDVPVVHNPVDVDRFKPAVRQDTSSKACLLTVGRLSSQGRYKGHTVVMQALPLIAERLDRTLEYRIVGDGDDREYLERQAAILGIRERVQFSGRVSEEELVRAYQDSDIFVMPSRVSRRLDGSWTGEGLGFVYVEAAACGKPVIGSDQGGAAEAIIDGVTGFAVDPTSPEAVAQAACRLLSEPGLAKRMGNAGREFAVKNFSIETFQQQVTGLLQEA